MALFRDRKIDRGKVITSSAVKINLDDGDQLKRMIARTDEWVERAWDYYDLIGEIKQSAIFIADAMARIRYYAADETDGDIKEPETKDPATIAAFARLGDVREMARKAGKQLFVVGQFYLVGVMPRDSSSDEKWLVASVDEVKKQGSSVVKVEVDGVDVELGPKDFIARIWREHPRRSIEADSSIRGILSPCDTLVAIDMTTRAIIRQRAASGSIVALPNDSTVGALDDTDNSGEAEEDNVVDSVMRAFITPSQNPGTAASVSPIVVGYERTDSKENSGIEVHEIKRPLDDMLDKITDRSLRRIAQGMSINVERVFGLGNVSGITGNSGQIQESDYRDYVEPFAQVFAAGLALAYLKPAVKQANGDHTLRTVGYDPSALVVKGDRQAAANYGIEHNLINGEAWREAYGFTDGDDITEEQLRQLLLIAQADKGLVSADDAANNRPATPVHITLRPQDAGSLPPPETPAVPELPAGPPPAAPTAPIQSSAAPKRATRRLGQRLAGIDRDLRTKVHEAAEAALARAEDKLAAKVISRVRSDSTLRALIRDVPKRQVPSILGEATLARFDLRMEKMSEGAFGELAARCETLAEQAWRSTARAYGVDENVLPADRETWIKHASDVLVGRMHDLTVQRLRDPSKAPETGEHDLNASVPMIYAREFVARAGGANSHRGPVTAVTSSLLSRIGDWVVGGIATGDSSLGIARTEVDLVMTGFVWDYGEAPRIPFEPHVDLDGVEFTAWDDDALANNESFPDSEFLYPGDHSGCFPAGTVVSGPLARGATLRHYNGEMVRVRFESGEFLTATPNHPVLTTDGWVPLGELHEGHKIVRCSFPERIANLIPGHYQMPARIEEVAHAFAVDSGVRSERVKVAAENFHGDGAGSQIAVVWADRELRLERDISTFKHGRESAFALADKRAAVAMASDGGAGTLLRGIRNAAFSSVRGSDDGHPLSRVGSAIPDQLRSLSDPSRRDSVRQEPGFNRSSTHAESLGKSLDGLAGLVEFDQVTLVERYPFSGHVFNLQTSLGWYVAGATIVHNCACGFEPTFDSVPYGSGGDESVLEEAPA